MKRRDFFMENKRREIFISVMVTRLLHFSFFNFQSEAAISHRQMNNESVS